MEQEKKLFKEVNEGYTMHEAIEEAKRCLHCKVPQCKKGCPISHDIPDWIHELSMGNFGNAMHIINENSNLPAVCGRVCPHEKQCEGHCVLGKKGQGIHVGKLERFLADFDGNMGLIREKLQPKTRGRVAVIGSGPAGLTIAIILQRYGYNVTIFEGKDKIGGVLRYGIPEFRLPKSVLDDIQYRHLELKGIKIRTNTLIGGAIGIDDLFRDGYKAIFVGTGVWKPNSLHIKGETFGNVHFGINYLNNPDSYRLGENVIVIGAGNAAMDVARTAMRKGSRNITCFSITKEVAASHYEFSYAQLEGVRFEYNKKPVEITDDGVIFCDVIENEDGSFTEVENSNTLYPADSVIISISQGPMSRIVNSTNGLKANNRGLLESDETGHTSRPGIFASGDVIYGARTVVEAVAHSKIVAESMHEYMQSLPKEG